MSFAETKYRLSLIQKSIIFPLGLIFLVLMNYVDYSLSGSGLALPFNNTTWIGFSLLMLAGLSATLASRRIKLSIFHIGYASVVILLFFPLLYSDTTFLKYEYMVILSVLAALFTTFLVSQHLNHKFKTILLKILFVSTLIQSVWGFAQYYFIFESNILFLTAEHGRPVGIFNQINVFATYINMGSLLALYFYFTAKKQTKGLLAFTITILVLNAHLNVLAQTKTGRVVSLIAITVYLFHIAYSHRKLILPLILITISILFSFTPKQWFDVRPGEMEDAPIGIQSLGTRPIIYRLSVDLIQEKPFIGHGLGQQRIKFAQAVGEYRLDHSDYKNRDQIGHVHNEVLQWLIQLGIVSATSFILLFGIWMWGLKTGRLDPTLLLLGLPFVGHSLLEFPFYTSAPHLLAFAIILGLSIKRPLKSVRLSSTAVTILIPVNVLVCLKTVTLMFASLAALNALTTYLNADVKDIKLLENTKPTLSFQHRFEIEKFEWKLDNGFKTGEISQDDIYGYIEWAEGIKAYYPMNKVYIRLAQSHIIAKDTNAAKRTMDEALFLFPDDEQVIEMVAKMKAFINTQ